MMTQLCFFIIADKPEPTKVTTVEMDSGSTEQVSSGKKVYLMRKCLSRIIINVVSLLKKFSCEANWHVVNYTVFLSLICFKCKMTTQVP